jgi:hypothetical protein
LVFTCEYIVETGDYGGYCRAAGVSFEHREEEYSPEENPVYKGIAIQNTAECGQVVAHHVDVSDDDIPF